MTEELKSSRISIGIHTVTGIIAGWLSFYLASKLYALGVAIVILIITGYFTEFALKKKGIKWWLTNGGVIYILVWLVSWVYFFNTV